MISIAPKHSAQEVPDAIYQTYASELRQYVNVRFDIRVEADKIRCIPIWTILESANPRWEKCRQDETISSDKIEDALLFKIADDKFGMDNRMPFDFWRETHKYVHDIVGEFVSGKLNKQFLNL